MATRQKGTKSGIRPANPPSVNKPDWDKVAADLMADPGEWYLVYENGRCTWANGIRAGHTSALHPDLGFEIRTANTKRGTPRTCDMYARFVPSNIDPIRAIVREGKK